MLKRSIHAAMRGAIEELLSPQFQELCRRHDRLETKMDDLGRRLDERIDRLDARITEVDSRLGGRIQELAVQQGRMIEQIASLRTDFEVSAALAHRIEDRVFAKSA